MLYFRFFILFLFGTYALFPQSTDVYIASLVPGDLIKNSNAVVRYDKQIVEINGFDKMNVTTKRIVTIFNKYGQEEHNAFEFYNSNTKIKKMEARIYDALGKEIKKIRFKDFTDQSAVSGATLYSDDRVKFLNYTPLKYPYTIEYVSDADYRSTAFVPEWMPIDTYHLAVQSSEFQIINNSEIEIKIKPVRLDQFNIEKITDYHFKAKNLTAIEYEAYNPGLTNIVPYVKSALTEFNMEGVKGINNNWQDFGKWMDERLLTGTDELPQEAIDDVIALTTGVEDKLEKARLVYKYMQDKTRYISVQVGIGGWKPMDATDVDQLGYADCKGLTNYTKALLEVVGVPSYYTVVYGDKVIRNMDKEFSATEGNHVILAIPHNNENIFLECTSQTSPFGLSAGFTDDRDVLLITPEGGKIVHTKVYEADDSLQLTNATVQLDEVGSLTAAITIKTTGYQYNLHEGIQNKSVTDQKLYYKEYWDDINNLEVGNIEFNNDMQNIIFKESVAVTASNYASKTVERLILQPNFFNRMSNLPPRYSKRTLDFKIQRAFKDVDEYIIKLPANVKLEAKADDVEISNQFGYYSFSIKETDNNTLTYKREYILNKGSYTKEEYEAFRKFKKQIYKYDKSKIVLVKNNQ